MIANSHRTTSIAIAALAMLLVGALAAPATAEEQYDYSFAVPLRLTKIPAHVDRVIVGVRVYGTDLSQTPQSAIATGSKTIRVPAGKNYLTTVMIRFNALPGKDMALAKSYVVFMKMPTYAGSTDFREVCMYVMKQGGTSPYDPSKPCIDHAYKMLPGK